MGDAYVSFEYYNKTFCGNEIPENVFNNACIWATSKVNQMTFGRLKKLKEIPDCVKNAICDLVQKYAAQKKKAEALAKSESNDGYSITYVEPSADVSFDADANRCIKMYLSGTGLLYPGTSPIYDLEDGEQDG